jgi:hypothetical protein
LSGPNKARIIRVRRTVAVATFKKHGVTELTPVQVNLLTQIRPFERSHYGISDQQWLEIEAHAAHSRAASPVV